MADPVGAFRDDAARARFLLAFDRAMSSWPDRTDHTVQTSYGRTAVSASTAARDRTPALLLPGGGSTIAAWGPFVRAWETDRQVFAVDTIWDAGRSVQTRPLPTGVEVAAWLEETLDGIGLEKVHLVGFSYGGWVALNQLVRNPARLQSVTAIEPPGSLAGIPWRTWAKMLLMLLGDEERYLSYLSWVRGGKLPESPALDVLLAGKREFAPRGTPRPPGTGNHSTVARPPNPSHGGHRRAESLRPPARSGCRSSHRTLGAGRGLPACQPRGAGGRA